MRLNGEASVNADTVQRWLAAAAGALHEQRDYLTQLDAAIGDADHGTNMDRGFTAVVEKLDGLDGSAREAADDRGLDARLHRRRRQRPALGHRPAAGRSRPRRRGGVRRRAARDGARRGARRRRRARRRGGGRQDDGRRARARPCARFRERLDDGARFAEALAAAREAAEEGMRATVPLQAQKGRASYLGERSIGHQDPGATSTALILAALEQSVAAEP